MVGKIIGTGSWVPDNKLNNDKMATMVDTSDEWIQERTGIVTRHIATEETTSSMAIGAARNALDNAIKSKKLTDASQIDAIIVCSMSPDIVLPCVACKVQEAIGAVNAFAYDLNAACSGFVFAYSTALSYIQSGLIKRALIIGAETLSKLVDWTDRSTCILFGDGAGAMIIEATDGECAQNIVMHSDGTGSSALTCDIGGTIAMDGQSVFKFATRKVPQCIEELIEKKGINKEDINLYILHQANKRIVEAAAKRLKEDINKFPMNVKEYGNTSSASIPILIDELVREGKIKEGSKMIMSGFGAGLTWGAAYIEM